MKKTSLKSLVAQQKVFTLLSAPSRLRVVNQLMATPDLNLSEIAKRTGLSPGNVHSALKSLQTARVTCMSSDGRYYVDDRTVGQLTNLCEDSAELGFMLSKFKPKGVKKATEPLLRAVL